MANFVRQKTPEGVIIHYSIEQFAEWNGFNRYYAEKALLDLDFPAWETKELVPCNRCEKLNRPKEYPKGSGVCYECKEHEITARQALRRIRQRSNARGALIAQGIERVKGWPTDHIRKLVKTEEDFHTLLSYIAEAEK